MLLGRLAPLLLFVGLFVGALTGCSVPAGDGAATASVSAFTVDHGDRFVVSATPERIVVSKEVDGVRFPFDEGSLLGKAILIHPVARRAATGVYARALDVATVGDQLVVTSEPLTLTEMENIAEDDIVRIYVDATWKDLASDLSSARNVSPRTSGSLGPVGFNGLDFSGFLGLSRPALLAPGITLSHELKNVSFAPEVLVDWTRENGLELGMRAALTWQSKLTIGGRVGGEFYHSMTLDSPPLVVAVPIGAVPVPVTLSASAFVSCSAVSTGPVAVELTIDVDASAGGSFYVHPTASSLPTSWVHEGRWKPAASGTASITPGIESAAGPTISCAVPRIELKALVAGAAGPFFAITPVISMSGPSPDFSVTLSAGLQGKVLGYSGGAEVTLLTWKP